MPIPAEIPEVPEVSDAQKLQEALNFSEEYYKKWMKGVILYNKRTTSSEDPHEALRQSATVK